MPSGTLSRMIRLGLGVVTAAVAAGLLASCAASPEPTPVDSAPPVDAGSDVIGDGYLCQGDRVSVDAFEARSPIADLSAERSSALAEAIWDDGSPLVLDDPEQWWIASELDHRIVLMRELGDQEVDHIAMMVPLTGADFERVAIELVGDAPNRTAGWYVMSSGLCALSVDLGTLTVPRVQLDPAMPPDPDSTVLHLLVTERVCNSGRDAEGRVELVELSEEPSSVSVVIGVRRAPGDVQTCPSNPATPFQVELSEPLGDRVIIDAALADPRPITAWEPWVEPAP